MPLETKVVAKNAQVQELRLKASEHHRAFSFFCLSSSLEPQLAPLSTPKHVSGASESHRPAPPQRPQQRPRILWGQPLRLVILVDSNLIYGLYATARYGDRIVGS